MAAVYERLRERLDMFPQGFPKTESGVELEILEHLFTEEEAEIALYLKPYPEPVAVIAESTDRDASDLGEILYDMSKKGLILRFKVSEEEIIAYCHENLAHYKVPKIIEFRGELPKTDVGKVSRRELREESEES